MAQKILIVDDEKEVCQVLGDILRAEAYEVHTATKGDQAIRLMQEHAFQMAVIDVRLEGRVSGVDLIKYAGAHPERPKVLVISATRKEVLEPLFKQEGVFPVVARILEKPADLQPGQFAQTVKALLPPAGKKG